MKKLIFAFLSVLALTFLNAQTFDEKIKEMIELSGASSNYDLLISKIIAMQREQIKDVGDDFWNRAEKMFIDSAKAIMFEEIAPIYAKYLTENEVDGIIAFYKSEAGSALVQKTPLIVSESMAIGGRVGGEIGRIVAEQIEDEKERKMSIEYPVCEPAVTGKFRSMVGGAEYIYTRTRDLQTETSGDVKSEYAIEWISDSSYTLRLLSSNDPLMSGSFAPLTVNITSCRSDGYSYLARQEGIDFIFEGELEKID